MSTNLECNVTDKTYPDSFKTQMVFADRVAVEAKVVCDFAKSLEFETNLLASVNKQLSVGLNVQFNEKLRTFTQQQYGIFYRPFLNFLVAVQYKNGSADTNGGIETTFYH